MTGSGNNGWLVPLADLSLILFVITGAGLAGKMTEARREDMHSNNPASAAEGIASAVFADAAQAELTEWLARHPPGPGEQLTVLGTYTSVAARGRIAARCEELAAKALAAGFAPRVIVQQGESEQVLAYLAHDRIPAMARDLLLQQ